MSWTGWPRRADPADHPVGALLVVRADRQVPGDAKSRLQERHRAAGVVLLLRLVGFGQRGREDHLEARGCQPADLFQRGRQVLGGAGQRLGLSRVGGLASSTQQDGAAVTDLAGNHGASRGKSEGGITRRAMLGLTQKDIAGDRTLQPGLEAS